MDQKGPDIIPQIDYEDFIVSRNDFVDEVKRRGVAVVRGVVAEQEARGYKTEVEEYVRANPWTRGKLLPVFRV